MKSVFQRAFIFFIIACVILSFSVLHQSPTFAQTEAQGITLTVRPGFDNIVKKNAWFPNLITLENNGAPIEGNLVVRMGDSSTSWKTAVSLPNQSRKQFKIPIYTQGIGRQLIVTFEDESSEVKRTVSPMLYPHKPALLLRMMA